MNTILDTDLNAAHQEETNFFDTTSYFIDEKVNFLKFENEYKVYNDKGKNIGSVVQELSIGQKALQVLINKKMLPFRLNIKDTDGQLLASVSRGWTFWMSAIQIEDATGEVIGSIRQKFAFFKPQFEIYNSSEILIAKISGDWKAWNFTITDTNQSPIGTISKKWAGAVKELFTSADKYNISIEPAVTLRETKIAVFSSAIAIDMILKEKK